MKKIEINNFGPALEGFSDSALMGMGTDGSTQIAYADLHCPDLYGLRRIAVHGTVFVAIEKESRPIFGKYALIHNVHVTHESSLVSAYHDLFLNMHDVDESFVQVALDGCEARGHELLEGGSPGIVFVGTSFEIGFPPPGLYDNIDWDPLGIRSA